MTGSVGKRIRQKRKEFNLTQQGLAKKMQGVSHAAISQWESDITKPNADNLYDLSIIFGCEFKWLLKGDKDESSVVLYSPNNDRKVPIFNIEQLNKLKIWDTIHISEMITNEYIMVDIPAPEAVIAFKVNDDSMAPDFLIGDVIVIDCELKPQAGEFVLARYNNKFIFRKFKLNMKGVSGEDEFTLAPLNDDYAIVSSLDNNLEVIGTLIEQRIYRRKR